MLRNCYTFKEITEKYGWTTNEHEIARQITYAKKRGIIIEKAFKEGPTYFRIIQDFSSEIGGEWKICPTHPYFEVNKKGFIRTTQGKKLVGTINKGYIEITEPACARDDGQSKTIKAHRLVMETFNPIENMNDMVVDHINGIRNDNRIENLRWVTQRQNMQFKDENYIKLNENYQKLIQRYGYDGLNQLFESILNTVQADY